MQLYEFIYLFFKNKRFIKFILLKISNFFKLKIRIKLISQRDLFVLYIVSTHNIPILCVTKQMYVSKIIA